MFWKKYKRLDEESSEIINIKGIFHKKISLFQAVFLIVGGTIGAGVLSIPYAVSKVGLIVGISYIIVLGLLMIGLNLLLGEVSAETKGDYQLVGLTYKYLGKIGGRVMTFLSYLMLIGVLTIYIIGEGEVLSSIFGGTSFFWSIIFFVLFGTLVAIGIRGVKTVNFFISLSILLVILIIVFLSSSHIDIENIGFSNFSYLFFPYGIILFAFHGTTSVPEARFLLKKRDLDLKKAIIISGLISITAYALFAFAVVGVTGQETTEIATIGLGHQLGKILFLFGNLFAILAMAGSFLIAGVSLKDSLSWDYKIPTWLANVFVLGLPLLIFLLGMREFIAMIDLVGGVFISIEMILVLLIYKKAKQTGALDSPEYDLRHTLLLGIILLIVLTIGGIYSVAKLF
ncbi:MAG TPA: aromatic amino acid transport family protein [Candidatus Magasanikbacteria bacterium]|jgi:amino acid permease|nr:amino acid permease [Candidatus Magasanikbacteria bacterium]HQF57007.1 aromatic amino acid transport family protein [Candidatus Magasanikbacteria bacterium]HQL52708.1 aromatic amino acid transport family protein [Candidatus Magasanikbacteria bacterium]